MVEDRLVIWKFKFGNKDALRQIYDKYKNDLLKLAVALVNDVSTAEDVVQDVFVSFAQSAARIRVRGNLKKYLATCVVNRIRNLKRDQQRHESSSINDPDGIVSDSRRPEQWAILSEELGLLSNAMGQIPYEQREVLALYMQGDMTFRQIAKVQETSVSTIQGRYRYGLKKLRSILNGEATNEADR
ncbi:MAG: sigma-70 family RNA polymerase sigma factor [Phycisphaerae bacterium]|nr:sigma-70 family RNA polymerase sigma factor [Phycisphaerae bacterium]NIP54272.1 sigma-70 family RNA polymerase sigma factor [Phycisphaerae bacterium]NIS53141.1 sigma-70 family RNA polymerase sigma factor [Phycisphaerae bacterium]NIU10626.1 sigma-70 family RNA polymerase sigma factor [Phycisphaerae bacterium]NIU58387.1 sigma-70 family RNA polymerase sigma factor [Phycisphaerae bacterium]